MKKLSSVLLVALMLLMVPTTAFAAGREEVQNSDGVAKLKVAVVLKTLSSEYWQRVAAGCDTGADENGCVITKLGPPTEDAVVQQINMVEDALAGNPDAIVFSPSQPATAIKVLKKAKAMGIPVILVDTPMPEGFEDYDSFIGTANYKAGGEGAQYVIDQMGATTDVNVVILEGAPGNPTCGDRALGAEKEFRDAGYNIVAFQPAYSDREKAYNTMQNILQTTSEIDIVFCSNDDMALGAQRACQQTGIDAKVIGFDGNKSAIKSILDNQLYATIAQRPENMGRLGVEYAIKVINGESVDKIVDAGVDIITIENAQAALDKLQ
jgi:ribose transport system substrate-binding protein